MLYSGAQFYLAYFFGGLLPGAGAPVFRETVMGWTILFLMLLRLRVTDEQKDFHHDVKAYPDRLLSRGIITMRHLYCLFLGAVLIEIVLCVILGWHVLYLWLGINLWFFLMYMEFFAPKFLNAHIGWYLVTHQLLIPIFAVLPMAMRVGADRMPRISWIWLLLFSVALMCGTMTYEIARKTWAPDREHPDAASYSRSWGLSIAILVNQVFAWTCGGLLIVLMIKAGGSVRLVAPVLVVNAVFLAVELMFRRHPSRAWSKRVEYCGAITMFVSFISATLAFAFSETGMAGAGL